MADEAAVVEASTDTSQEAPQEGLGELSLDVLEEYGEEVEEALESQPGTTTEESIPTDRGNGDSVTTDDEVKHDNKLPDEVQADVDIATKELDYDELANEISNGEYVEAFSDAVERLPDVVIDSVQGNPEYLAAIYQDVKSGLFDKVMPAAQKLMDKGHPFEKAFYIAEQAHIQRGEKKERMDQKRKLMSSEPRTMSVSTDKDPGDMGTEELEDHIASLIKK